VVGQQTHQRIDERVESIDWDSLTGDLDAQGSALIKGLLRAEQCTDTAALYGDTSKFRGTVIMSRHGFGKGEYKYFAYPLPRLVADLRASIYPHLAPVANAWNERLRSDVRYPPEHPQFLARCADLDQTRPTPLLLQYRAGDYNCLHQDLYGPAMFPLQLTILLSQPGRDFEGGEFVLVEQRPRMQSRAEVVPLRQGDAVVFPVNHRPAQGLRGAYRVKMRHGVSRVRVGLRHTLGIIFHDAK
jgi:uncharacterized protein